MTEEDFDMFEKAAEKRWPDAVMTNSGSVFAFSKIAAKETLGKRTKRGATGGYTPTE